MSTFRKRKIVHMTNNRGRAFYCFILLYYKACLFISRKGTHALLLYYFCMVCVSVLLHRGGPRSFEGVRSSYFCGRARYSIEGRGPPHTILQLLPTVSSSTPAKSVPAHHSPTYNFYRGGELKVHVVSGYALFFVNI